MTEKRFTIIQDGDNFSVMDNLKNRYMGMFEFKEDEFPTFFFFQQIIDLLNELNDENEQLEKENKELKGLLKSMADKNNEIWLHNGQIIRLKKVFKGECVNDRM